MKSANDFEIESHTADLKIRAYGKTIQELFKNALVGMFQAIGPQSSDCRKKNGRLICTNLPAQRSLKVTAENENDLLINFLSEALYLSDVHNEAYLDATIKSLSENAIQATLHGISITRFEIEIKAVTYHAVHIEKLEDGTWTTAIVFDI
jgi:SHS2 domain-containing protein